MPRCRAWLSCSKVVLPLSTFTIDGAGFPSLAPFGEYHICKSHDTLGIWTPPPPYLPSLHLVMAANCFAGLFHRKYSKGPLAPPMNVQPCSSEMPYTPSSPESTAPGGGTRPHPGSMPFSRDMHILVRLARTELPSQCPMLDLTLPISTGLVPPFCLPIPA